jgi:hypothetical protein
VRASKKLRTDEHYLTSFAPTRLRMELDRVPLWRGEKHVAVKQLVEDFARYLYLPRLKDSSVLLRRHPRWRESAHLDAGQLRLCRQLRRNAGRYKGLRGGTMVNDGRCACAGSGGEAGCGQQAD